MESNWIKVKDKLPKEGQHVLVLFSYKGEWFIQPTIFNSHDSNGTWNYGFEPVVAWLPIPSYQQLIKDL